MSGRNKKILIITTRQNNVWLSMQEIIPALEMSWSKAARESGYEVITLMADEKKISKKVREGLLDVDVVFIAAFNVLIAQKLVLLRKYMFIDAPWIFQLHNQATIGLWPLFHWGMGELLTTKDTFISTCSRDAQCFNALVENTRARIIPFTTLHHPTRQGEGKRRFCYVGRISEQKNLHTLLWAYHLYRENGGVYTLDLIGGEDDLGSPNMGMKGSSCLSFLKDLCRELGLGNSVQFLGLLTRHQLHDYWGSMDCVVVNPSLHSDENFGMALMQALTYGHPGVVTDWGGHTDFTEQFSSQIKLLKVYESPSGPYLDIKEFSYALMSVGEQKSRPVGIPRYYSFESVVAQAKKVLCEVDNQREQAHTELKRASLLEEVLNRVEMYESQKNGRIFESYQDPLAHKFLRPYGMENTRTPTKRIGRAPWCAKMGEKFVIKDPHRGQKILSEKQAQETGDIQ